MTYRMNQTPHKLEGNWYKPGDWELPAWWTDGPYSRDGRATYDEQVVFYNSNFCRESLGHTGGMTTPPKCLT